MGNRLTPILLVALLAIIQAQLWFGQGSVPHVRELQQALEQQKQINDATRRQVEQTHAEVNDLSEGLSMVEDQARSELGMVKPNEIFVQIAK
jgi:cell division protein FtsB